MMLQKKNIIQSGITNVFLNLINHETDIDKIIYMQKIHVNF